MAISERIHFFRLMRGMTQKYLGTAIGFPEKSADVRLAQYETVHANRKQTLQMHWHRCLMFLHRLLMFLT